MPFTITPINVGHLRFDLSDIYRLPEDHPYAGQTADVPMFSYHIALPGRSLLVDAADYDPAQISADLRIPEYQPPPSLLEQLETSGIEASDISDVIITHAHFDHYGALGRVKNGRYEASFPQARHYLNKADWQPELFDELEERTLNVVARKGLLDLVEGELDIGDGLTILPLPGETEGHQILCLAGENGEFYFGDDLYHHALEMVDPSANVYWAAAPAMRRSKAALMERAARNNGKVYFTHIAGSFRVASIGEDAVAWERVEDGA